MTKILFAVVCISACHLSTFGMAAEPAAGGEDGGKAAEQVLYNGIALPSTWPPRRDSLSFDPEIPPYLISRPDVIPIDVGRQLFVDDFLIESTTLRRTYHRPAYHSASPVLKPDREWERGEDVRGQGSFAAPFSGGVWYDPRDKLYKMWYHADYAKSHLCYATSRDGVAWNKPSLDVVPGTNIVFPGAGGARVVWLDLEEKDPSRRFKLILTRDGHDLIGEDQQWWGSRCSMYVHFSPDGIHWGEPVVRTGPSGDRNSGFWNPFRKRWVFSIREYSPIGGFDQPQRCRRYWESPDLIAGVPWKIYEPTMWVGADSLDLRREPRKIQPELYNLDAVAYESVILGLFSIMRTTPDRTIQRCKINEVCVGFSRDGFHWHRPDRRPFCGVSEQERAWNWGNVQSVGGGCLVVGDKLHFYVSGRTGTPAFHGSGVGTGLAILRRDGFASMDANETIGTLTTRPIRFTGNRLFVNAETPKGELTAEILDARGSVIAPFSRENCRPIAGDKTSIAVTWKHADDLSSLRGKPVRFRFHLRNGRVYSFWVSAGASGASRGYVATGGPPFTGPTDTIGMSQSVDR
ncbi:MAG TPA: hypothetical protein QF564_10290 [Pirellulaceae bacterium]|nr:hypothetical protein [Pirellulaceae bacterium]